MLTGRYAVIFLFVASLGAVVDESVKAAPGQSKDLHNRAEFVARFASDPIYSVNLRSYIGFEPLGTNSLVIYDKGNHGYLLTVSPCWDLPWTTKIGGIISYMNILVDFNAISTDKVAKCVIKEMRRVNVKAMKAAEKADKAS